MIIEIRYDRLYNQPESKIKEEKLKEETNHKHTEDQNDIKINRHRNNKQKKEVFYDFSTYEDTYIVEKEKDTPLLDIVYDTLSGDELQVFIMHVIDELKHREIAKIMKKPLGTITWLYNKALKKVKERIGDDNE